MKLRAARSAPGRACSVRDAMTSPSARLWSPSYAINTVSFQRNEPNNREIDGYQRSLGVEPLDTKATVARGVATRGGVC